MTLDGQTGTLYRLKGKKGLWVESERLAFLKFVNQIPLHI